MVIQGTCGNNRIYNIYEGDYGREGFINNYVNKIKETFKMSPAYFEINEVTEGNIVNSLISDAWLIDEDSYKQEIGRKKIIMYPEQDLNKGTIYNIPKWDNQKWMVTAIDPENLYYNNGFIRKCNYLLKWIDKKTNNLCQQWCIVENKKKFTTGLDENTAIIVGDGDFQITLPTNEFTKRLKRDDRFLISTNTENPQAYKVSRIDNTSNPDLILVNLMEKGAELSSYDNKIEMISDYYKYYDRNGNLIENSTPPIQSSSDYSVIITGNSVLRNTQVLEYTANIYKNGVIDASKTVDWTIDLIDKISIISQTGLSISLKGLTNNGTITLKATINGGIEYVEKSIKLTSIF